MEKIPFSLRVQGGSEAQPSSCSELFLKLPPLRSTELMPAVCFPVPGLPEGLSGADRGGLSREPEAGVPIPAGIQRQGGGVRGQPAHEHPHGRHRRQPVTSRPSPELRPLPGHPQLAASPPAHPSPPRGPSRAGNAQRDPRSELLQVAGGERPRRCQGTGTLGTGSRSPHEVGIVSLLVFPGSPGRSR